MNRGGVHKLVKVPSRIGHFQARVIPSLVRQESKLIAQNFLRDQFGLVDHFTKLAQRILLALHMKADTFGKADGFESIQNFEIRNFVEIGNVHKIIFGQGEYFESSCDAIPLPRLIGPCIALIRHICNEHLHNFLENFGTD